MTETDLDHARRILAEYPMDEAKLSELLVESPYRGGRIDDEERIARFEHGVDRLRLLID